MGLSMTRGWEAAHRQSADEVVVFPVTMRDADPQAFAYAASTVAARHVGGSPGLIDKKRDVSGIKVKLAANQSCRPLQDVRRFLLRGMRTLFFARDVVRLKKRWIVPKPKKRPRSARLRRTSSKVASFSGPKASTITLICASIRPERRSPPSALGWASPCSRSRLRPADTGTLTPKRSAAARCDRPWPTAARTRTRNHR